MTETTSQNFKPEQSSAQNTQPKLLALYLPQFHPTPENDLWWGKGYTEWANVANAKPLFPGHYQPHLPADLGFYDLRLPEARKAQADLAREHGVYGFCYYHYWFKGRRLLERPFEEVLESGEPDFPFCLAWANHTWTWKRDHNLQGRLMEQEYSEEDDREHIRWLIEAFKDRRYIRVEGRPMLLIYWTSSLPNPERTFEIWREECEKAGELPPYVVKMDSFGNFDPPQGCSCDAATEFWPHSVEKMVTRIEEDHDGYRENKVYDYREFAIEHLKRLRGFDDDFTRFACVVPGWDNTARWKSTGALVLENSTPEVYERWLAEVIGWTKREYEPEKQFVLINAWNEWGEGTHLEPDLKHGRAYLEATRRALEANGYQPPEHPASHAAPTVGPLSPEARYEKLLAKYGALQGDLARYQDEEEHSPLIKRADERYAELEARNRKIIAEFRVLQGEHRNLRKRFNSLRDADFARPQQGPATKVVGNVATGTGILARLKSYNEPLAQKIIMIVEKARGRGSRDQKH